MNNDHRELLRVNLLQQLRMVGADSSLPLPTLVNGAHLAGHDGLSPEVIRAELVYLLDKELVASPQKLLSPENKRWRITAAGTDFLASSGL